MKTTHLIIALNCLIYGVMLAVGEASGYGSFPSRTLIEFGAIYSPLVRDGQWWRLGTMMFIHITFLHLVMNMIALYQVGVVLEPHFGRLRFVALYLAAGLGGSLVSLAWHFRSEAACAGASGAISGLIGAGAIVGHLLGTPDGRHFRDAMLRWALVVLVFGLVVNVDNAAHAGGFVVGTATAWLLDRRGRARRRPERATAIGFDAVLLVAVVSVGFGLAGRSRGDTVTVDEVVRRGIEAAQAEKTDDAIVQFRRAVRMAPDSAVPHADLALSLLEARTFVEAEQEARRAVTLDAEMPEAWWALSQALLGQGKNDEAAPALVKYAQLAGPTMPAARPAIDGGVQPATPAQP
jgi:rhomboid protease GluP